ncbi:methylmalonyl Co-A mutase-associated GTPase MeaB [Athalassotoga saccharophila]|uniref:methylmalonyl Co-A mutase-associated GTPase MeaB n=1 Tax=Athalassotoga saccharophila TaxID=1441386 RepID=UPI00137A778B|nr:methylmalonyl Co-A mutase-associated GTPase MeaB [Athalassotoga saccharophila]BBJ28878.1 putative GTPase [Athalassotoga saccharophila]
MQISESQIINGISSKDRKSFAKLLSICESDPVAANRIISRLQRKDAHVVGITGSPGVGKSSIINAILSKSSNRRVGVIAVDPSSPFSGGALLGDRIRMQSHATDQNVFIRSFASRGALGGLSPSIFEVCDAFETFDMDMVLIETVGVGQSDTEVANIADTVVLLLSPDGGDEIQMMKAGIMEIADIFVVNKSDNPASISLKTKLEGIIKFGGKDIPVILANSITGDGVEDLIKALDSRFERIKADGTFATKRKKRVFFHAQSFLRRKIDTIMQSIHSEETDIEKIEKELMKKLCSK